MSLETAVIVLLSLLDLASIIAVIFVERKNPASTIAWVLVIILLPFLGFAVYGLFGSGFHINKKKRFVLKQISDSIYREVISRYITATGECRGEHDPACARVVSYLNNDGGHYLTRDNAAVIFTDGRAMFETMIDDMRRAQKHIHLLYYIFRNDSLGREIVTLLTEKARAGVEVRVMYDSLGSLFAIGRMFKPLIAAGGKVEAFSPLFSRFSSHLRLNYRNHRKITVIDGLVGYVGGMNIGNEYLGKDKKLKPWRDTQIRLTGTAVALLQERFLLDWLSVREATPNRSDFNAYFPPPLREGTLGVQIVSSGPDTALMSIKNGLLEMLYAARRNVFIQTPYFTPDDSFIDALRIAARAGVDVRLMLPGVLENPFVQAATYSYARLLLEAGVKVYRYQGFIHAKTMVFDGIAASIGTANIGNRSFALNFEVNAFIYDREFAADCEAIFLGDQARSLRLDESWFAALTPPLRGFLNVARLFAPLI